MMVKRWQNIPKRKWRLDHREIEQDLEEERKAEVNGTRKTDTIARTGR
jgi:hypothetical protein